MEQIAYPPVNGTEERLDAVICVLVQMRKTLDLMAETQNKMHDLLVRQNDLLVAAQNGNSASAPTKKGK